VNRYVQLWCNLGRRTRCVRTKKTELKQGGQLGFLYSSYVTAAHSVPYHYANPTGTHRHMINTLRYAGVASLLSLYELSPRKDNATAPTTTRLLFASARLPP
jgi:hypothetical protein